MVLEQKKNRLIKFSLQLINPSKLIIIKQQKLQQNSHKLLIFTKKLYQLKQHQLQILSPLLESFSYKNTLKRGFVILLDQENQVLKSTKQIKNQQIISARLSDGEVQLKKV